MTGRSLEICMVYVVVLEDEVVCKRIINRLEDRQRLRLKSDNPSFVDYEVGIEDVRQVLGGEVCS